MQIRPITSLGNNSNLLGGKKKDWISGFIDGVLGRNRHYTLPANESSDALPGA